MSNSRSETILAIESAIGGGSIAVFKDGNRIDGTVGATALSRAEDLLPNVDQLLVANRISRSDLTGVIVSAGPGSFTGIRIGISTAIGLGTALAIPIRQISVLSAMAAIHAGRCEIVAAVPVGREIVCKQTFRVSEGRVESSDEPTTATIDEFIDGIATGDARPDYVMTGSLFDLTVSNMHKSVKNAGNDMASILALAVLREMVSDETEPLFVGKQK